MIVIWQLSGENDIGQTRVKRPKQRIAKGPVVEAALAARGLEEAEGPEEGRRHGGASASRKRSRGASASCRSSERGGEIGEQEEQRSQR